MGFQVLFLIWLFGLSANLPPCPPPLHILFSVFMCLCLFEMKLWCTYGMQCSPSAGSLRGATHPQTHNLHTPQMPFTQQLRPSVCFKGAPPCLNPDTHPALLAAGIPSGPDCVFAAASFDFLFCAAVLQLSWATAGLEGRKWGMSWGLGVDAADRPSSRYSPSFVIFMWHVFPFLSFHFCSLLHQNSPKTSQHACFAQRFHIKISNMSFIHTAHTDPDSFEFQSKYCLLIFKVFFRFNFFYFALKKMTTVFHTPLTALYLHPNMEENLVPKLTKNRLWLFV